MRAAQRASSWGWPAATAMPAARGPRRRVQRLARRAWPGRRSSGRRRPQRPHRQRGSLHNLERKPRPSSGPPGGADENTNTDGRSVGEAPGRSGAAGGMGVAALGWALSPAPDGSAAPRRTATDQPALRQGGSGTPGQERRPNSRGASAARCGRVRVSGGGCGFRSDECSSGTGGALRATGVRGSAAPPRTHRAPPSGPRRHFRPDESLFFSPQPHTHG